MRKTSLQFLLWLLTLTLPAAAQWTANPRADLVLGNRETLENSITTASGLAIDSANNKIYVSCQTTHRVLRFDLNAVVASADPLVRAEAVLGQPHFNSTSSGLGPAKMNMPGALAIDKANRLWVADRLNRRILRFDQPWAAGSGADANSVLGQVDLNTANPATNTALNGLAADHLGNLYVSDGFNHSVYRYNNAALKGPGSVPDMVFGQPNLSSKSAGLSASAMTQPWGLAVYNNSSATTLFVADKKNNRVLRFDNAHAATSGVAASGVLGQPDFLTNATGTAMSRFDAPEEVVSFGSSLFVSDKGNGRTLRFPGTSPQLNASAVASLRSTAGLLGGLGSMAFDSNGRLWGTGSSKVCRFDSPAGNGTIEPTASFGTFNNAFQGFRDIVIDPTSGKVFISSQGISAGAVYRFANYNSLTSGQEPEASVCYIQSAATASAGNGLFSPAGMSIDPQGRLWVADSGTAAVYGYPNAANMAAHTAHSHRLGGASGNAANQMTAPQDVFADAQGRVWVADTNNHRVLRFDNAASKPAGANADAVLGQTGFGIAVVPIAPSFFNLHTPRALTGDSNGNLYIADTGHHRVLRYNNAAAKANGASANGVLGQVTSNTGTGALGATGLDAPSGLAVDSNNNLWVSEAGNRRLVRFPGAASLANGASADVLVGQPSYWHNNVYPDYYHVTSPMGITVDPAGRLYVADPEEDRMLRFSPVSLNILTYGFGGSKNFTLSYSSTAGAQYDIEASNDLQSWSWAASQTANNISTAWTAPVSAQTRRFFRVVMK